MSKILENVAKYSTDRISLDELTLENYISTENILQNKNGKVNADKLPPKGNLVTKYDKGDILIANIRPYLKKIWYASNSGGSSSDVLTLKVKSNYNSKFIYYSLFRDAFFDFVMAGSKGTKMPRGDKNQVLTFSIPTFNFEEQTQIAKVLSNLDAKIELNNKINAELEAMAKLIYDYWFVQFEFPFDFAQGKPNEAGKPYKSSGGKMVWNEELKRVVPEGWEVNELGNCINVFDSIRVPLSRTEREKIEGDIPYYGATSIMGYVNDFLFNDDYILLAEDGSVMDEKGRPIVQFIWGKSWVNNHAHVIQAKNKFNNEFIYQLVKMIPVVLIKTGSIQMKINQENLKKYKVLIPSLDLIEQYSNKANSIRKQLIINIEQNQKLAELRDWLLPMLMNGQVRVEKYNESEGHLNMAAEEREKYR